MTNINNKSDVPEQEINRRDSNSEDLQPASSPPPNQRIPPVAPPPMQEMFIDQQIRENRSRSMLTGNYQHMQYQKLKFDQNSDLPKSSLQMEDTSTFAHPSKYKQIIYINTKTLSGFDLSGRPRRHTFATSSLVSQRIPSAYREILIRKGSIREPRKKPTKIQKYNKPVPPIPPPPLDPENFGSESFAKHLSKSDAVQQKDANISVQQPINNPQQTPNESPALSKNSDFSKGRSMSEESQGQASDGNDEDEENPDEPNVYGLQYQDGFIDFVEHPPTSLEEIAEDESNQNKKEVEKEKETEKEPKEIVEVKGD